MVMMERRNWPRLRGRRIERSVGQTQSGGVGKRCGEFSGNARAGDLQNEKADREEARRVGQNPG